MKDYKDIFTEAYHSWEKKRGFLIFVFGTLGIYFLIIKSIITDTYHSISPVILNVFFPILIFIIILVVWLISTNRIVSPKTNKFTLGLFLNVDEDNTEKTIKKIVSKTINEIKSEYPGIKLILKPINYSKTKQAFRNHVTKNSHSYDTCIYASVDSGNRQNKSGIKDEIVQINDITFIGKFNIYDNLKIFKTSISLSKDLKFRNLNKKWSYIESNSFDDKKNLKENLKDTILFYSGIYLIYLNKTQQALEILKTLHNPDDSKVKIIHSEKKIIGNQKLFSSARLNEILLSLFIFNSSNSYSKNNLDKAYNDLIECERIFGRHPYSYEHYIPLARYSYELGKFEDAIKYTLLAKQIKHYGTEIYLNEGFFAILDKNEDELLRNYNQLRKTYNHQKSMVNFTEVIGWLENKKQNENILFEYALGTLNFLYSDKNLGIKILKTIYNESLKSQYPKIYDSVNQILTKGVIKPAFQSKSKTKSKKRRK